jgi:hypothetical protein
VVANLATFEIEDMQLENRIIEAHTGAKLGILRELEKHARETGHTGMTEKAAGCIAEIADKVQKDMGLPPGWDVVRELGGEDAKLLLKKTEETEAALLERLQKLVDETYWGWGGLGKNTRTRDRAADPIADRLVVRKVVYVQNAENYVNYTMRKRTVVSQMTPDTKVNWDVKTQKVSLQGVGRHSSTGTPVDASVNEYFLWHGTSVKAAEAITNTKFRMSFSGTAYGSLFGCGIYFAESCMKADEYTTSDSNGWFPLILCRVMLGRVNYCDAVQPRKLAADLEASCKPGSGYHSVLGDREKVRQTFREFIVYDEDQVYPEYIVWYERKF